MSLENTQDKSTNLIKEVFSDNLQSEMKKIYELVEKYNYIAMVNPH